MKLVLSPAKSLNFESNVPTNKATEAYFLSEAQKINALLKKASVKRLSQLIKILTA